MLALSWDNITGRGADLVRNGGNFLTDEGLEAAVLISLETDAPANADDELPSRDADRRGYWGDYFSEIPGDVTGSRAWLLSRSKLTQETLTRYEEYDREALEWLITDGVATRITVTAEARQPDRVLITIDIIKSNNERWRRTWERRLAA